MRTPERYNPAEVVDRHKTCVGRYITGPIVDSIQTAIGKVLGFPFRAVDWAIDSSVAWARDAVKGVVGGIIRIPTKK